MDDQSEDTLSNAPQYVMIAYKSKKYLSLGSDVTKSRVVLLRIGHGMQSCRHNKYEENESQP